MRGRIELRSIAEWLPKDLLQFSVELLLGSAQYAYRLAYRFVLYPTLVRESGYSLTLVSGGQALTQLCEDLSGTDSGFWAEHPKHCVDIYMKRENADLQSAQKMGLFLCLYCVVMLGLQKCAPGVLQGRGVFFGLMNIFVVVALCLLYRPRLLTCCICFWGWNYLKFG